MTDDSVFCNIKANREERCLAHRYGKTIKITDVRIRNDRYEK
jgi:hypothetical protein